jgi:hypothetical protein
LLSNEIFISRYFITVQNNCIVILQVVCNKRYNFMITWKYSGLFHFLLNYEKIADVIGILRFYRVLTQNARNPWNKEFTGGETNHLTFWYSLLFAATLFIIKIAYNFSHVIHGVLLDSIVLRQWYDSRFDHLQILRSVIRLPFWSIKVLIWNFETDILI